MFEILIISNKFIFIKTKNKEDNIEREKKSMSYLVPEHFIIHLDIWVIHQI
jgi:hypothetical protein